MKALAPDYAPASFWKCASTQIAKYMHDFLQQCSTTAQIPHHWHSGTLCFLPKHSKRSHSPKDCGQSHSLSQVGKLYWELLQHTFSLRLETSYAACLNLRIYRNGDARTSWWGWYVTVQWCDHDVQHTNMSSTNWRKDTHLASWMVPLP